MHHSGTVLLSASLGFFALAFASIEWMTKNVFSRNRNYMMKNKTKNKLTTRLYRLTTLLVLNAQL